MSTKILVVPLPKQLAAWVTRWRAWLGGFVAQFKDPQKAVLAAVYSHSAIADKLAEKQYVVLPHQISEALPKFMYKHQAK